MGYIRFVVGANHPDTEVADGIFRTAYRLLKSNQLCQSDRTDLEEALAWLSENLQVPERFNRSASKGFYRRKTKGIAWLLDTASEHIARMRSIERLLAANGYSIHVIHQDRIGYVVYRDEAQVVAEPFADTKTGP